MDTKKFIQLVEEKKKRVLEKKEAPLKWEQKLEAAAKAKADAEAKVKKNKRWKISDTENSDDVRKFSKKRSKKQWTHDLSDSSGDNVKVEKKHRSRKNDNHHCKHHRHQMSSSDDYTLNSDERKIHGSKHSRRSAIDDLVPDSNDHRKNRNQSGGNLSDDVREEEYCKPRNFKKATCLHDYSDERKIHESKHYYRSSSHDLAPVSNDHLNNRNQSRGKLPDDVREEYYGKPQT